MKLSELQSRKDDMEQLLIAAITGIIEDFEKQTGLVPSAIDVEMVDAGRTRTRWAVEQVSAEVEL